MPVNPCCCVPQYCCVPQPIYVCCHPPQQRNVTCQQKCLQQQPQQTSRPAQTANCQPKKCPELPICCQQKPTTNQMNKECQRQAQCFEVIKNFFKPLNSQNNCTCRSVEQEIAESHEKLEKCIQQCLEKCHSIQMKHHQQIIKSHQNGPPKCPKVYVPPMKTKCYPKPQSITFSQIPCCSNTSVEPSPKFNQPQLQDIACEQNYHQSGGGRNNYCSKHLQNMATEGALNSIDQCLQLSFRSRHQNDIKCGNGRYYNNNTPFQQPKFDYDEEFLRCQQSFKRLHSKGMLNHSSIIVCKSPPKTTNGTPLRKDRLEQPSSQLRSILDSIPNTPITRTEPNQPISQTATSCNYSDYGKSVLNCSFVSLSSKKKQQSEDQVKQLAHKRKSCSEYIKKACDCLKNDNNESFNDKNISKGLDETQKTKKSKCPKDCLKIKITGKNSSDENMLFQIPVNIIEKGLELLNECPSRPRSKKMSKKRRQSASPRKASKSEGYTKRKLSESKELMRTPNKKTSDYQCNGHVWMFFFVIWQFICQVLSFLGCGDANAKSKMNKNKLKSSKDLNADTYYEHIKNGQNKKHSTKSSNDCIDSNIQKRKKSRKRSNEQARNISDSELRCLCQHVRNKSGAFGENRLTKRNGYVNYYKQNKFESLTNKKNNFTKNSDQCLTRIDYQNLQEKYRLTSSYKQDNYKDIVNDELIYRVCSGLIRSKDSDVKETIPYSKKSDSEKERESLDKKEESNESTSLKTANDCQTDTRDDTKSQDIKIPDMEDKPEHERKDEVDEDEKKSPRDSGSLQNKSSIREKNLSNVESSPRKSSLSERKNSNLTENRKSIGKFKKTFSERKTSEQKSLSSKLSSTLKQQTKSSLEQNNFPSEENGKRRSSFTNRTAPRESMQRNNLSKISDQGKKTSGEDVDKGRKNTLPEQKLGEVESLKNISPRDSDKKFFLREKSSAEKSTRDVSEGKQTSPISKDGQTKEDKQSEHTTTSPKKLSQDGISSSPRRKSEVNWDRSLAAVTYKIESGKELQKSKNENVDKDKSDTNIAARAKKTSDKGLSDGKSPPKSSAASTATSAGTKKSEQSNKSLKTLNKSRTDSLKKIESDNLRSNTKTPLEVGKEKQPDKVSKKVSNEEDKTMHTRSVSSTADKDDNDIKFNKKTSHKEEGIPNNVIVKKSSDKFSDHKSPPKSSAISAISKSTNRNEPGNDSPRVLNKTKTDSPNKIESNHLGLNMKTINEVENENQSDKVSKTSSDELYRRRATEVISKRSIITVKDEKVSKKTSFKEESTENKADSEKIESEKKISSPKKNSSQKISTEGNDGAIAKQGKSENDLKRESLVAKLKEKFNETNADEIRRLSKTQSIKSKRSSIGEQGKQALKPASRHTSLNR